MNRGRFQDHNCFRGHC